MVIDFREPTVTVLNSCWKNLWPDPCFILTINKFKLNELRSIPIIYKLAKQLVISNIENGIKVT